jgi:hypothetical protein
MERLMSTDEFRAELLAEIQEAADKGSPYVDINSGALHRKVGGYPGTNHRMPACCDVMYAEKQSGDEIMSRPPKGKGASLTIRYKLPR